MTLTVGGLTSIYQSPSGSSNDNYDTPTNPKITKNSAFTQRVFGIIHTDDTLLGSNVNTVIERVGTALLTEYSNLDNTKGHTIRCYDGTNGVDLASIDLTTDTYFVLIHSDDANMHHFAKIDTVENADSNGDSFTFEPKLGNRVAKGTKFMIFKGPSISNSTKIIAITGGLDASTFGANYVVSRPLWYFYNDKTVKDNELDHNTKYFVRLIEGTGSINSIDLSTSAEKVSFVTMAETHYRVIDSSKYSYVVKLKDELKIKDDPDTATSNESSVLTGTFTDYTDYNDCFINARRDNDDNYSALSLNGLTRYTHYRDSPMKSNLLPNVFSSYVEESIDGKAGFSETQIIDNNQIISKKLSINQDYRIRQSIGQGSFNDWLELGEIDSFVLSGSGLFHYSLRNAKYGEHINISEYFEANEEIRIGDRICIVNGRNGANIVIKDFSRLETEGKFTNTTTLSTFTSGTKVFRRAFSKVNSNLLTTVRFEDTMLDKLRVVLYSDSANAIEATVVDYQTPSSPHGSVSIDNTYQLLYLNFENNYHDSDDNGLEYVEGDYVILYEVFTGTIEKINKKIEKGNNIVVLSGRNSFSKVVNPIINKDSLYSLDTIYSSRSPYVSLTSLGTTITTLGFDDKTVNFGGSLTIAAGTEIYTDIGFIGKIDSSGVSSATTGELEDFPTILANAETVYKKAHNQIIFNKAQASNLAITSTTDLSAAADKGLSFREGTVLTSAGAEESDLAGTSSDPTEVRAVGYDIDNTDSVGEKDSIFLAKDTIFTSGKETINTMIDFTILSVRKEETNNVVKLAPYVPLTLGRSHPNFKNTSEITFTKVADAKGASSLNANGSSIDVDGVLNNNIPYDTPIYIDGVFVGRLHKQINRGWHTSYPSQLKIKRTFPYKNVSWNDNALVQIPSAKNHHELHLTNGAHLHGGKTIALLGPKLNIINFETFDNSTYKSYSNKFGHSIFRIFNLEKGKIGAEKSRFSLSNLNTEQISSAPIYNYYATAYKGRNKVNYNKLGGSTSNKILPIERRGILPATCSNYARPIIPNYANVATQLKYLRFVDYSGGITTGDDLEDSLFSPNPTASRLFLFINSDLYPYSSSRTDSLMNSTTRDIKKYGLLSMKNIRDTGLSEEKEKVKGQTTRQTHLDGSYSHSSIIESNKTLSSLKRFGLMRLTEFMTDFAFNPINPETKINKEAFVRPVEVYNFNVSQVADSGGSVSSIANTSDYTYNSLYRHTITFTNTPVMSADDLLVDLTNGVIWGKVISISGADVSAHVYHKPNNGNYYTGFVYIIKASDVSNSATLTGRLKDAAYFNDSAASPSESFHPQKALIFGEPSNNGFSDSSAVAGNEFDNKYSQKLVEFNKTRNYGMSSPLTLRDDGSSFLRTEITLSGCQFQGSGSANLDVAGQHGQLTVGDRIISSYIGSVPAGTFVSSIAGSGLVTLSNAISASVSTLGNVVFETKATVKHGHLAAFMKQFDYADFEAADLSSSNYSNLTRYKFTVLDKYSVQDDFSAVEGQSTTPTEMFLTTVNESGGLGSGKDLHVPIYSGVNYAYFKNQNSNIQKTNVAGVYAGYKFFIDTNDTIAATSTRKAVGNNQYHAFKLSHLGKYNFLKFVDLTGCYLVPVKGKDSQGNTISRTNNFGGDVHVDSGIAYIVSHNYDTTTSITNEEDYSWIITDIDIDATNEEYVIMQPNPVCMWNQSPKEISINHLSRKYTKKSNGNEMYEDIRDFHYLSGQDNDRSNSQNMANEGIRSMYVIVDSDNITNSGFTVLRTRTEIDEILDNTELELCLSDGERSILSGTKLTNYGDYSSIVLDRTEYLEGVVSVSEPFELKVSGDIQEDDKRAIIGSTLDISKDAEDLVEELFKENDITHSLTRSNYSIYASPDFQGTSLYTLSKYLLNLKDKELFDSVGTITSRNIDSGSRVSKFEFNDDNIIEYELVDSGFDFYNEIVVYGSSHRAIKKNIRSIKEIGKKTLEIFEKKLKSQIDVDKRAFDLLKIHNNDVSNLNVKTHIRDAETLSSGDIVTVEIKQENIPRNLYVVLEMKYEISGITTLVLGKYIKNIEDRFAEVLLANNQTDSYLRRNDYPSNENTFDFFENLKIKEIQLTIRKRTQTGITLGFSHTLNTNASTIGFGGGTISHTTLLEEDL